MKTIHHITKTEEVCPICGKPFDFYWYDPEEKNGRSETKWGLNGCHKACLEKQTGRKIKGLRELNEERKRKSRGYDRN